MKSYTFLPDSGVLYQGTISEKTDEHLFDEYIASYERSEVPLSFSGARAMTAEEKAYVANNLYKNGNAYKLTDIKPDLYRAQVLKKEIAFLKKRTFGARAYDANINRELGEKMEEYRAVLNGDNTNQLTIVPFVNEIIGHLEQPSYIAAAFKNIPLDKLRGKIPEMGWPAVQIQNQRLQEPEITSTEFGQYEFRIFRNDIFLEIPREDRMEATIDPFPLSMQQGQIQMMRARELLALKALSSLQVNGTYGTIPDITLDGANTPRAGNDAPSAFVSVMVDHFTAMKNYLKYFVWNPIDYRAYLSNWFTHGYTELQVPEGFGVVPFKGLEKYGAVAIISPYSPRGYVYSLGIEGAYELDGPKIIDSDYDIRKFADLNVVHDFIGYQIVNPTRYGEKLELAGITPGTEITTDEQIYDLLAPPANIVTKNSSA